MYLLVDESQNIVLGSRGCLFKLRYRPQNIRNQIKDLFLPLIWDSLYCPLRLKQLQLSVVEESTAKVPDRFSSSQLEYASSSGFCDLIWCALLTGVRHIPWYILFFTIHAHLDGVGC